MSTPGEQELPKPRMIMSINQGDGEMVFVQPSSKQHYPTWTPAEKPPPPKAPTEANSDDEYEDDAGAPDTHAADSGSALGDPAAATFSTLESSLPLPDSPSRMSPKKKSPKASRRPSETSTSEVGEEQEESAVQYSVNKARQAQDFVRTKAVNGFGLAALDLKPSQETPPKDYGATPNRSRHRSDPLAIFSMSSPSLDSSLVGSSAAGGGRLRFLPPLHPEKKDHSPTRKPRPESPAALERQILSKIPKEGDLSDDEEEHKLIEDRLLDQEFRSRLWTEILVALRAARVWTDDCERIEAAKAIQFGCIPTLHRRLKQWQVRAERRVFSENRFAEIGAKKPMIAVLRAISNFFIDWDVQSMEELMPCLTPLSFRAGEPIFHEGDYSRDMYLVHEGCVEIVVRTRCDPQRPKSRRKTNGVVVAHMNKGDLFGDGACLHLEPRMASAFALTDVDLWRIKYSDYVRCAATLPPITHERFRRLADDKRRDNIRNCFPLTPAHLQRHSMFKPWHVAALQHIVAKFRPRVYRAGDVIATPLDGVSSIHYVLTGELTAVYLPTSVDPTLHHDPYELAKMSVRLPASLSDANFVETSSSGFRRTSGGETRGSNTPSAGSPTTASSPSSAFTPGSPKFSRYLTRTEVYPAGTLAGVKDTVFGSKPGAFLIVSKSPVELWTLSRDDFLDTAREFPRCVCDGKDALRAELAACLPHPGRRHPALDFLKFHPLSKFCIPMEILIHIWVKTAKPIFCAADSTLVHEGEEVKGDIMVITSGAIQDLRLKRRLAVQRSLAHTQDDAQVEQLVELDGFVVISLEEKNFLAVGLEEFCCGEGKYFTTIRCASDCTVWRISRKELEQTLENDFASVWMCLIRHKAAIRKVVESGDFDALNDLYDVPAKAVRNHHIPWDVATIDSERSEQTQLNDDATLSEVDYVRAIGRPPPHHNI
jgi:CRP-like cAMP-binding protein